MIRQPAVAGQFYPAAPDQLKVVIKGFVDEKAAKEDVIGMVCPHAGYVYSGPVVGAVMSRVKFKDTFVLLGPNHTGRGRPASIMTEGEWRTPLGTVRIDAVLARQIRATSRYLEEDYIAHEHEHSLEVQVPFLQYFKPDVAIVPITLSFFEGPVYREIGRGIAHAIKSLDRDVIILASSDMTHYEPQEAARRKDNQAIEAILALDPDLLLQRVAEMDISMCGYAPAAVMLAAVKEMNVTGTELVRYQTSGDVTGDYRGVVGYAGIIVKGRVASPLVKLARQAVEAYVREGRVLDPPPDPPPEMKERAGVFVSIHRGGDLRGCIGTFEPQTQNVAEEIIANAVSAATRDPRFQAVSESELPDLDYSVDVLSQPEPARKEELDPKQCGVIVECGWRRGLLLPDLEGVDTVEDQIEICCQKAGIMPQEPVKLYRFRVKRHK